jgi:hypothetical protein
VSSRTGEIIADVISTHTFDPDAPPNSPECMCGARPLDGAAYHVARMVQHALASRSNGLADTKLRILAGELSYGQLQALAVSGVDAFDLLQVTSAQDIETYDRAAHNGTTISRSN